MKAAVPFKEDMLPFLWLGDSDSADVRCFRQLRNKKMEVELLVCCAICLRACYAMPSIDTVSRVCVPT